MALNSLDSQAGEAEPEGPRVAHGARADDSAIAAERRLVARVLAGDREGAIALYRLLSPAVERTLRRILGRREADHDDLVQQSFEQIVRTLREARFSHACPLSAWASTLTARVALSELRRRCRSRRYVADTALDDESVGASLQDWQDEAKMRERLDQVRRELARLEPGRARVLYLHDVEGYRLADIAVLLGTTLTAVQSRLLRGRSQLVQRCRALDREVDGDTLEEEP